MERNIEIDKKKKASGFRFPASGKKVTGFDLRTPHFELRLSDFRLLNLMMLILFISVLFSSCEDVIDVKLSSEDLNLFGVEAKITTLDEPTVFLYKTLKVNQDEAYPGISGHRMETRAVCLAADVFAGHPE